MPFEQILAPIANVAGALFKAWLEAKRALPPSVRISWDKLEVGIAAHLAWASKWANSIKIHEMEKSKYLNEIFVEPSISERRKGASISPERLLSPMANYVIYGRLGIGKTTLLKYITNGLLKEPAHTDGDPSFPIVIRLKELGDGGNLFAAILSAVGILEWDSDDALATALKNESVLRTLREAVIDLLGRTNAILLIDGADEVSVALRKTLSEQLSDLSLIITGRLILTCRTGGYTINIQHSENLHIQPFSEEQLISYVTAWFKKPKQVSDFFADLRGRPYKELAFQPLQAATLCAIFDADRELPPENVYVYEKTINMRLRDWDAERGVIRSSAFKRFGPDEKRKFLASCAFHLALNGSSGSFNQSRFIALYKKTHEEHRLPEGAAVAVLNELEAFTGIVLEERRGTYEFVHKSLFEFLLGDYLSRLPKIPNDAELLLNNPDGFALATILSHNSDLYLFAVADALSRITVAALPGFDQAMLDDFVDVYLARIDLEGGRFHGDQTAGFGVLMLMSLLFPNSLTEIARKFLKSPGLDKAIRRAVAQIGDSCEFGEDEWVTFRRPANLQILSDDLGPLEIPRVLRLQSSIFEGYLERRDEDDWDD